MPRRTPAYLENRREQLLSGARKAFAEYGFEGTTVAVLERELGVTRGAIFNYWPNKMAIFLELAERDAIGVGDRAEHYRSGPAAVIEDLIARGEAALDGFGVYFEALRAIRRDPALWKRWEQRSWDAEVRMREVVAGWQQAGIVRPELDPQVVLSLIFTSICGIVLQVALSPEPDTSSYASLPALVAAALAPAG